MTESLHAQVCLGAGLLLQSQASFFWVRSCYMHTIVVPLIHFKSGADRLLPLSQLLLCYCSAFQSVLVAWHSCKHAPEPGAVKCLWCVLLSWLYGRSHHCIINSSLQLFKALSCLWESFTCEKRHIPCGIGQTVTPQAASWHFFLCTRTGKREQIGVGQSYIGLQSNAGSGWASAGVSKFLLEVKN